MKRFDRYYRVFVALLIVLTVALRVHRITAPIADWHSWRQADTAAVARNFLRNGFTPLTPRFDDYSNIPSGLDNLEGYRMVEFPLYQLAAASLSSVSDVFTIEVWLRIVSIASAAGSLVMLMELVRRRIDTRTSIAVGFVYAVLPFNMYYGRAILPDTFVVFWALLSLLLLDYYARSSKKSLRLLVAAATTGAIALLVKPTSAFLLLPSVYLLYSAHGFSRILVIRAVLFGSIVLFPLWWWRSWIAQYPEGIPAYTWLLNKGNIRFKGAWFYWLFAERVGNLILGYWGLMLLGGGVLARIKKQEGWFFVWWVIGVLAYLVVFAAGNVQHDYYQILIIPTIAVFVGKGIVYVSASARNRITGWGLALVALLFMLAFSWYDVRSYYWINRPDIVEAGRFADQVLPDDAIVIAPYNGDTSFLYQTGRPGWPIGFDIDTKIANGATHYVTVSPTDEDLETKELAETYTVIERNERYAVIDLTSPKPVE